MVKSGVPSGVPSRLVVSIGTPLPRPRPTSYRGILRLTQARNPAIDTPSTPRRRRGFRVSAALWPADSECLGPGYATSPAYQSRLWAGCTGAMHNI